MPLLTDKDKDLQSKTMMSQVSFAMSTLMTKERAQEMQDVLNDNDRLWKHSKPNHLA